MESVEDFEIGDKVVLKKEGIDQVNKTGFAESFVGCSLTKEYYDYLIPNFEKLGYFEIRGFGSSKDNLYIDLYLGKDLFEHYQEECSCKKGDRLAIGSYEGIIDYDSTSYGLNCIDHHTTHCDLPPDFKSIEDSVISVKELNKKIDSKKESDLTTTKNYQNNEIKFQRAKASCKRGVVPKGSTISGRKDKIAISIGHLSYQVCNC